MPASPHDPRFAKRLAPDPYLAEQFRYLMTEISALRGQVARHQRDTSVMHMRLLRMTPPRHGWLKYVVRDLETNPRTQYKVHFYGAIYWLVNFPLVIGLFFLAPGLWTKLGIFITLVYSIYANFATDYGGMSAAMASFGGGALPDIPAEPPSGGQIRTPPDTPDINPFPQVMPPPMSGGQIRTTPDGTS